MEMLYKQQQENELLFNDYERVQAFIKTSIGRLPEFSDLVKELGSTFLLIDRYYNKLGFTKCNDFWCCHESKAKELKAYFQKHEMRLSAPTFSSSHEGLYKSFLQEFASSKHNFGYDGQPTKTTKALSWYEICPNYSFNSKTARDRHESLFLRRQTKALNQKICDVCGAGLKRQSCLNRHRSNEKHAARNLWEQTEKPPRIKKKKIWVTNKCRVRQKTENETSQKAKIKTKNITRFHQAKGASGWQKEKW